VAEQDFFQEFLPPSLGTNENDAHFHADDPADGAKSFQEYKKNMTGYPFAVSTRQGNTARFAMAR
jgi:hypothetical protein